jgi:elongation factor P
LPIHQALVVAPYFSTPHPSPNTSIFLYPFYVYICNPYKKINNFMATTADMRTGLIIKLDNNLYSVVEFGQNKTARAAAKVWAKLKGVDNTRTIEHTWNSGDNIFPVRVEKRNYQYLYKDDSGFNLMDNSTFEQIIIAESMVEHPELYKDGQECFVIFNTETEVPMSVELPSSVNLRVTYSEPGLKGDTATRAMKSATLETGAVIQVPLFVNEGDLIKVDAKNAAYVERVKE